MLILTLNFGTLRVLLMLPMLSQTKLLAIMISVLFLSLGCVKRKVISERSLPGNPSNEVTDQNQSPSAKVFDTKYVESALLSHVKALSIEIGTRNGKQIQNQQNIVKDPSDGLDLAQKYIENQLTQLGVPYVLQSYELHKKFANIEVIMGDTNRKDDIVIGAHYDSAQGTPGADDNASGVAVLLEVISRLSSIELFNKIRFVFFTNEEPPFFRTPDMGSARYVSYLLKQGISPRFMVSLEMLGFYGSNLEQHYPDDLQGMGLPDVGNYYAFVTRKEDHSLAKPIHDLVAQNTPLKFVFLATKASIQGVDYSDHLNFWNQGIPAAMITDTAFLRNSHYHKATDTAEKLNYESMSELVKALSGAIESF